MPNQIIFEKDSSSELSLFVVANGEVEVLDKPRATKSPEFEPEDNATTLNNF
jgi:hypothetical protein